MKKKALLLAAGLFISVQAQDKITNKEGSDYEFTVVTDIEATDVKAKEEQVLVGVFLLCRLSNLRSCVWVWKTRIVRNVYRT